MGIYCWYKDKICSQNKSVVLNVKICVSFSFQYICPKGGRGLAGIGSRSSWLGFFYFTDQPINGYFFFYLSFDEM